jgi:hypothetical protein
MADQTKLTISKINAARTQLDTAIELWFYDCDPVSIHTLAAVAYQITHDIKRHRGIDRDLLYDSRIVKPEYRKLWLKTMKEAQNFFKHADNDPNPDTTIELPVFGNLVFLMVAAAGLQLLGISGSYQIGALMLWLTINEPTLIHGEYLDKFNQGAKSIGIDNFEDIRSIPKAEFFDQYMRTSLANVARAQN